MDDDRRIEGKGSRLKPLACPKCGRGQLGRTDSKRPPPNDHPERWTLRSYVCLGCGERYTTKETYTESALRDVVVVGRAGDGKGSRHAYSRSQMETDLAAFIPKGLTAGERVALVFHIEHRVEEYAITTRRGLPPDRHEVELGVDELVRVALLGLADAASRSWHGHRDGRDRVRVAHAQYALATLGTFDPTGKWKNAQAFIRWLERNYPHLRLRRGETSLESALHWEDDTWIRPLVARPTSVTQVVKNSRHLDDDPPRRPKRDFSEDKIRGSIARALRGRDSKGGLSEKTFEYVMWQMVGQRVVRTSQLSSAIAATLRGVDDIAYLRWVSFGKELDLGQLYDEAIGLVRFPSPRLIIRLQGRMSSSGQSVGPAGSSALRRLLEGSADGA